MITGISDYKIFSLKLELTVKHDSLYRISSVIHRIFTFFRNSPRDLGPSYKTVLDLWDCLGRVNLAKVQRTECYSRERERKSRLIAE